EDADAERTCLVERLPQARPRHDRSAGGCEDADMVETGGGTALDLRLYFFSPDGIKKSRDVSTRLQMVHPLCRRRFRDKLPVFWRHVSVAERDHPETRHGAAPERAIVRPALRRREQPLNESLGDEPVMRD